MSMKHILTLLFTLAGLAGMAQTNQPLPPDAQPLTALTYLSPSDSTVWLYNERSSLAINVGVWADVVELFETGWSNTQIDSAIAAQIGGINFPVTSVNSMTGDVTLAPTDLGLGNVDNTPDANKPISTATQEALDLKENAFSKGSLVAGTGVTLSGTLANRLVGSGNVTINVPNVVTTNSDQSGIGGTKDWIGLHSFSTSTAVGSAQNTIYAGAMTAGSVTGMVLRSSNYNNTGLAWELRNYAHPASGVQLSLTAGGISSVGPISAPNLVVFTPTTDGFVPASGSNDGSTFLANDGSWKVPPGGGGGTATNLSVGSRTATTMVIGSSTGSGATLPSASTTQAGLLSAADKAKINGVPSDFSQYVLKSGDVMTGNLEAPTLSINQFLAISRVSDGYFFNVSGTGFGTYNKLYFGRPDGSTTLVTGNGNTIWHAGNLNPSNFLTTSYAPTWASITGKPSTFTPSPHSHNASDINSGTLASARIPNLAASKITSGTLSIDRLPTGTSGSTVALGNHTHSQYVPTSRTISTGLGLTGGGDLASSRTFSLDLASLPAVTTLSEPRVVVTNSNLSGTEARMSASDFATTFGLLQSVSGGSGVNVSGSTISVDNTVIRTTGNQTKAGTLGVTNIMGTSTTASSSIPTNAQSLFKASISSSTTYTLTNLTGSPRHIQVMITNTSSSAINVNFNANVPVTHNPTVPGNATAIFTFLIENGSAWGTKLVY